MEYCDDCGSRVSGGYCTWCQEEVFIAEQHEELGTWDECSDEFKEKVNEQLNNPKTKHGNK